jgi:hypothetical protein
VTGTDKVIRDSTIAAVVIVAAVAASFSYLHALEVIGQHSRPSRLNLAAPLCIDGLIFAGSMVLLNDARRGLDAHWLAYGALGLGIAATLTINVVSGLAYGIVGAVVAAWPAVALVLSYELLMIIVRRSARPEDPAETAAPVADRAVPEPPASLNGHGHAAVEMFADDIAAGTVPSIKRIRSELKVGQPRAQQVRGYLTEVAASNGHGREVKT